MRAAFWAANHALAPRIATGTGIGTLRAPDGELERFKKTDPVCTAGARPQTWAMEARRIRLQLILSLQIPKKSAVNDAEGLGVCRGPGWALGGDVVGGFKCDSCSCLPRVPFMHCNPPPPPQHTHLGGVGRGGKGGSLCEVV